MTATAAAISAAQGNATSLLLRGITKQFPGILANDSIDLDIHPGEVHAILGENGAGKSTLMKILYGYYQPTSGSISLGDTPLRIRSPQEGRSHGIGMVFQNFTLVPALTVIENIALILPGLPWIIPTRSLEADIRTLSERYNFGIDPKARVSSLSLGERQKVEIMKLLLAKARFLIFDEPTSVLAPQEIDELLNVFRKLREDGLAVLFITHKLREVLAVADRITVLRKGAVAASIPSAGATEARLVSLMLGEENPDITMPRRVGEPAGSHDDAALMIHEATVPDPAGRVHLKDISVSVRRGEIIGVAGIAGNGQVELGEMLLGLRRCSTGSLRIFNSDASGWSPAQFLDAGVSVIPEDPLRLGSVPSMSVLENMILSRRKRYSGSGGLTVKWKLAFSEMMDAVKGFGFSLPRLNAAVGVLSGGNVQRVVIAREMAGRPGLLVAFYPTRGMDVPSANSAREVILRLRSEGSAVILVSEDLDELFALSDRLLVMHGGRIVGDFPPHEIDAQRIGFLMTGAEENHAGV